MLTSRAALSPTFNLDEMNKLGQQHADALKAMQAEVSALFEQTRQAYTDRIEVEQQLTAELISNLLKVKSMADGATVYQNWMSKHFQLWTEDEENGRPYTKALCCHQPSDDGAKLSCSGSRCAERNTAGGVEGRKKPAGHIAARRVRFAFTPVTSPHPREVT